ncbi:MAG: hypothetical protein ACK4F9_05570 [Brevinematia bacterium]
MPDFVDITNRIDKEHSKKYSLTIAYVGKRSLYAFKNRVEDTITFFNNISNIEIMYVDTSKTELTDIGDVLSKARVIIPNKDISISEAVNTAISLASAPIVVVMTVNYRISLLNTKTVRDLFSSEPTLLCITPTIISQGKRITETVKISISNDILDWIILNNAKNPASLTPNNFLGIYNKNLFNSIGGFITETPTNISLIEFGMRAWSSGCIIISAKDFILDKIADFEIETNLSEHSTSIPSFKYFFSKKPLLILLKDLLKIPFYIITFKFKNIFQMFIEISNYLKNKDKISLFTPEIEKIASIISYYKEEMKS